MRHVPHNTLRESDSESLKERPKRWEMTSDPRAAKPRRPAPQMSAFRYPMRISVFVIRFDIHRETK